MRKVEITRRIHNKSHSYDKAHELSRLITAESHTDENFQLVVITGRGGWSHGGRQPGSTRRGRKKYRLEYRPALGAVP